MESSNKALTKAATGSWSVKKTLFCHASVLWTLVALFWTKMLFLQETVFSPGHFTREKSRLQKQPSRGVLKICSKFTAESPSLTALRHGCSPVNLLPIFRTPFLKNTSGQLLLRLILPGIHVFWCKE